MSSSTCRGTFKPALAPVTIWVMEITWTIRLVSTIYQNNNNAFLINLKQTYLSINIRYNSYEKIFNTKVVDLFEMNNFVS